MLVVATAIIFVLPAATVARLRLLMVAAAELRAALHHAQELIELHTGNPQLFRNDVQHVTFIRVKRTVGEGRLDFQTAMGKAPVGVAKLAKKHHAKVIAFAGSVTKEAAACNKEGIDAFFPILRNICTLAEAMDSATAKANMTATAEQVFRLL